MRKICLLLLLIAAGLYGPSAFADTIQPEHRVCERDADCKLIATACSCKCGGDGHMDAVNQRYAPEYKYLEQCSESEIHSCAQAGACAQVKIPSAACQNEQCMVVWTPVNR